MSKLDLSIVFAYVMLLFVVGIAVGMRETAEDFLILSRRARFVLVLFSFVSTWVGVGVFIGTASAGYQTGISVGLVGAMGALIAVFGIAKYAPLVKTFGDRYHAHTLGDFFRIRYSRANQMFVAFVITAVYLLFTAVQFTGFALLLQLWAPIGLRAAVGLAALTTIVYTAFAGIKSDFYTDVVHFWVIVIVVAAVLLPSSWHATGGLSAFHKLPAVFFDPFAYRGVLFAIGGLFFGAGVAFVSMEVWQRIYASETSSTARTAVLSSGIFVVAFYFAASYLGMMARVLFPTLANRDLALFQLMKSLLPSGVLGFGIAAFFAVFISSINTMLMVVSATWTKDLYKGILRPSASDKSVLLAGRISTVLAGCIGLVVAYFVHDILSTSVTALFTLLILVPPVIGGFLWKRATATAALWSMIGGVIISVTLIRQLPEISFVVGFGATSILFIVLSLVTSHSSSEELAIAEWKKDAGMSISR